jgi:voltage-gated potassium channel
MAGELMDGTTPFERPEEHVRRRVYRQIEPQARTQGLSLTNKVLVALIIAATALAIAETEPMLIRAYGRAFTLAEYALGSIFAAEYAVRLWTAPERDPTRTPLRSRLGFIFSPAAIADLIAVGSSFMVVGTSGALLLRWVRLARIVRLAKLGRMSRALDHIVEAVLSRRDELLLSLVASLSLIVLAATALYLAEGAIQPAKFGSIPRALWWSVATMTTIGYGDVYPITPLGKVLASITGILSIGLIAMPTGILAAAFSDGMDRHRRANQSTPSP